MADTLVRTHPLEAHRAAFAALTAELAASPVDLAIELAPLAGAVDLRVDPGVVGPAVVGPAVLGVPLPTRPNTWTSCSDGRVVWLGPDEWLVTGERPGAEWEEALRAVVAPLGGTAVDVSDQRTGVRLRGSGARELLAFGCALDLRPASFPPGSCAQTLLGQAGVLLIADQVDDGFVILTRTSFAGYVADWLLDAAQELRPSITQGPEQERNGP